MGNEHYLLYTSHLDHLKGTWPTTKCVVSMISRRAQEINHPYIFRNLQNRKQSHKVNKFYYKRLEGSVSSPPNSTHGCSGVRSEHSREQTRSPTGQAIPPPRTLNLRGQHRRGQETGHDKGGEPIQPVPEPSPCLWGILHPDELLWLSAQWRDQVCGLWCMCPATGCDVGRQRNQGIESQKPWFKP